MNFPLAIPKLWLSLALLWSTLWKGLALWHASRRNERYWFMAILVINTLGLLEIFYLALKVKFFQTYLHTYFPLKKSK